MGSPSHLDLGNLDWSMSVWINPDNVSAFDPIAGKVLNATDKEYGVVLEGDEISVQIELNGNDDKTNTSAANIQQGVWTHVVATFDASELDVEIYVDGVVESTTGTIAGLPDLFTANFEVGRWAYNSAYFDGRIAHVQMWNRVLGAEEVVEAGRCPGSIADGSVGYWPLWEASGDSVDYSDQRTNGTRNGNPTEDSDGPPVGLCGGGG